MLVNVANVNNYSYFCSAIAELISEVVPIDGLYKHT